MLTHWLSQIEADIKADNAKQQAQRDEKARAEAEAARVRLTPLEDRLTRLLATVPIDVQRDGLSLAALQASLKGRRRGNCHPGELGAALRRLGFVRYYVATSPSLGQRKSLTLWGCRLIFARWKVKISTRFLACSASDRPLNARTPSVASAWRSSPMTSRRSTESLTLSAIRGLWKAARRGRRGSSCSIATSFAKPYRLSYSAPERG